MIINIIYQIMSIFKNILAYELKCLESNLEKILPIEAAETWLNRVRFFNDKGMKKAQDSLVNVPVLSLLLRCSCPVIL